MSSLSKLLEYTDGLQNKRTDTYQVVHDLLKIFHQILSELDAGETVACATQREPVIAVHHRELKKMNRVELLELLLTVTKENHQLQEEITCLQEEKMLLQHKLEDKRIAINQAGTIAEAAFQLNGVYDATNEAAQQYLDNLALLYEREKLQFEQKERETQEYINNLLADTERKCLEMEATAKKNAEMEWKQVLDKLESFYEQHQGLKELLNLISNMQEHLENDLTD